MQHGSIPMSMDTEMLFDLFLFSSERLRERSRDAFFKKAVTINQLTNRKYHYDMLTEAFKAGFKKGLNLELHPLQLTETQWQEVQQLAQSKYESKAWNLTQNKERASIG